MAIVALIFEKRKVINRYPFGMVMEDREYTSASYRFGWQSMERDDEIAGDGNHYSTLFRPYDPRLGRWWAIDPETSSFPWQSPFVTMSNNPISRIDPLGNSDDDITLDDDGKVVKVEENDDPNRFFDKNGNELFLNDSKELDVPMLKKNFMVGEKVYEPISRQEVQKTLDVAGTIDYNSMRPFAPHDALIFAVRYAYASYHKYDFAFSYLKPKLNLTTNDMVELFYQSGYVDGVPFIRFEGTNILYNVPDAGNFLWGKKAFDNNLPKHLMLRAAALNESGSDTEADQEALSNGYGY